MSSSTSLRVRVRVKVMMRSTANDDKSAVLYYIVMKTHCEHKIYYFKISTPSGLDRSRMSTPKMSTPKLLMYIPQCQST